jgi:hypothetical protein
MKSQIDYTRLNDPFIVNCALCRKRIKDVKWEEKYDDHQGDIVCVSVNCHGRYWSCTFTRRELERKGKSGLIELLAFENDSYSLTIKDIEKEKEMKGINMPENDEKKEIKIPIKEGDLKDEIVSQLIKEKMKKDPKETVVGRKGHVDEGQAEPKEFTNNELMSKLEEIVELNGKLIKKFEKMWERIEWIEEILKSQVFHSMGSKINAAGVPSDIPNSHADVKAKVSQIANLLLEIVQTNK